MFWLLSTTLLLLIQSCGSNLTMNLSGQNPHCLNGMCEKEISSAETSISTSIFYSGMTLNNKAQDGYINATELSDPIELVSDLNASGHVLSLFSLARSDLACEAQNLVYQTSLVLKNEDIFDDGAFKVCVILEDRYGDLIHVESPSFIIDRSNPNPVLSGAPMGYSNKKSTVIALNDVSKVRYTLVDGSSCDNVDLGEWSESSEIKINDAGSDGSKTLCLEALDQANNSTNTSRTWILDTTVPPPVTLSNVPNNPSADSTIDIDVIGSEIFDFRYKLIQGSDCLSADFLDDWIPASNSITENLGADGAYVLCVQGRDIAGNIQVDVSSYSWIKGTYAPGSALINNAPSDPSASASLAVSISGDGVVQYDFDVVAASDCSGASYSGSWNSIGTPITQSLGIDQTYTLCVIGRDAQGVAQPFPSSYTWSKETGAP